MKNIRKDSSTPMHTEQSYSAACFVEVRLVEDSEGSLHRSVRAGTGLILLQVLLPSLPPPTDRLLPCDRFRPSLPVLAPASSHS